MESANNKRFSYGYVIAAACFSIQAIGIGIYVAFGVFFNPLMSEFGWSRAAISGASSLAFFMMGLFGIVIGRLNDRFGPRLLMAISAIFLGLGCMLMSRLEEIWQIYLFYGIIFGLGLSSVDIIALSTIVRWFSSKRGMMTGIVKVGTGAGQLTIPLLASVLISFYGWRTAYFIIGLAAMVLLVGIARLLKRDPGPIESTADEVDSNRPVAAPSEVEASLSFHDAKKTMQLWTICFVNLTIVFCLLIVMVHIVPHARDIGVTAGRAAGVLSTIGAVSMVGRFVTGVAIDRIGGKKAIVACYFLLIAGILWLQTADQLWMLYLFACIYGLAHGGFFTAFSPLVAELFGIGSHGVLFGIVVFFGTTGGALGPIMAGYIFDTTGSYHMAFWLIILISIFGLAMTLSVKPVRAKIE